MSPANDGEPREGQGVLANLPRTRPQHASPRRTAARRATVTARARRSSGRGASASAAAEPVPRQGYECESERATGPVHPPGGAELVASVAEIVGELARTGFSTAERVLRDVLARVPLS